MAVSLRSLLWQVLGRNPEWKPRRVERRGPPRDSRYRAWIRTLPCATCGSAWQIEAAHTGSDGGTSQKASDYSCVPLCKDCHTAGRTAYHRIGKQEFERKYGIDFRALVRALNIAWKINESRAREDAQTTLFHSPDSACLEAQRTRPIVPFADETPIALPVRRETGNSSQQKEVA